MNITILNGILYKYGFIEKLIKTVTLQETKKVGEVRLIYLLELKNKLKLVCRISHEREFSREIIEQQCCFSEKLRKKGIPVAKKYRANGSYCITCFYDLLLCCITLEEYVGVNNKKIDLKMFALLGEILGKMHMISENDPTTINYSSISKIIKNDEAKFNKLLTHIDPFVYKHVCIKEIEKKHDMLVFLLKDLLDQLPHGAIHGDLSVINNLCVDNEKIRIIDFNLASDDPYLCDMLICIYSSIYKQSNKSQKDRINVQEALSHFILSYYKQRKFSLSELDAFSVAAALFDGLYYCKSIIEEYNMKADTRILKRLESALIRFDPLAHKYGDMCDWQSYPTIDITIKDVTNNG